MKFILCRVMVDTTVHKYSIFYAHIITDRTYPPDFVLRFRVILTIFCLYFSINILKTIY